MRLDEDLEKFPLRDYEPYDYEIGYLPPDNRQWRGLP